MLKSQSHKSYKLVYALFDNYESDETKPEVNTKEECAEIMEFLNYVTDSEPMKVCPHVIIIIEYFDVNELLMKTGGSGLFEKEVCQFQ